MPGDLIVATLYPLNQNIAAVAKATGEIVVWLEQQGAKEASQAMADHLTIVDDNSEVVAEGMVELLARRER